MILAWSGLFYAKNLWQMTKCRNVTNETKGSEELQQVLALKIMIQDILKADLPFPKSDVHRKGSLWRKLRKLMGQQLLPDANELKMLMPRAGFCSVWEGVEAVQAKFEKRKRENSWHCSCRESGWSLRAGIYWYHLKSVRMRDRLQVPHPVSAPGCLSCWERWSSFPGPQDGMKTCKS